MELLEAFLWTLNSAFYLTAYGSIGYRDKGYYTRGVKRLLEELRQNDDLASGLF